MNSRPQLVALCLVVTLLGGVELYAVNANNKDASLVALTASAPQQTPPAQDKAVKPEEQPAEKVYKNIQVLQGLPSSQVLATMTFFAGSLGVACNHCHTNQFAEDTKPTKQTARRMIQMMRKINADNFENKIVVNCATCHQGSIRPSVTAPLAKVDFEKALAPKPATAEAPLPSADAILDKYVEALGGRAKIDLMTTQVMKGTRVDVSGSNPPTTVPVEIYRKAPNKLLMASTSPGGTMTQAFDGTKGWRKFGERVGPIGGPDLLGAKRDAIFLRNINIKEQYASLRVVGKEMVGPREAYVIEGTFTDESPEKVLFGVLNEKLYFDTQTGLLIRRYLEYKTPFGQLPEATDYEDYRTIDGLKMPAIVRYTRAPFSNMHKFDDIKLNAAVADEKFAMPAPAPTPKQ
jgi:hypothetical protein